VVAHSFGTRSALKAKSYWDFLWLVVSKYWLGIDTIPCSIGIVLVQLIGLAWRSISRVWSWLRWYPSLRGGTHLSEKCDFMGDTREISFLSLSLPAVTHAEGTVDAGVYISPVLRSGFPCGTSRIAPEFSSDLFWLVVPTITCLYLSFSHDLSLIVILNCPAVLFLKFFKGKQIYNLFILYKMNYFWIISVLYPNVKFFISPNVFRITN
jgi:hypothetical protein